MGAFFQSLGNALAAGAVLVLAVMALAGHLAGFAHHAYWAFLFRWLHVLSGVMWLGLLYYFNFVQIPMMPKIPDEQKPAVSKFIAPEALWYFRWSAMGTFVVGILLALINHYFLDALTLGATQGFVSAGTTLIGIGMWLGTIMWFNVWFVIWPNQQRALNIDNKFPDLSKDQKAAHGRTAMLFSRTNTFLSVPMLVAMTGASTLF